MEDLVKRHKVAAVIFLIAVIIFLVLYYLSFSRIYEKKDLVYGVTFSKKKMDDLGLDWRKAYVEMLDDLKIKKIRLSAYWNDIEKNQGNFIWDDIDWQLAEAGKREVEVVLAVGGRLPRWPECHYPDWSLKLEEYERQEKTLEYIGKTIDRYKNNGNIKYWQIENEPFLRQFGECPDFDSSFLDKEIEFVKKLDSRPIIITDSGELSLWFPAAKRADIFGTTMYRDTFSSHLGMYIHYPITPAFFRIKKNLAGMIAHPKDWIVIELQAEPWCEIPYESSSKADRDRTMNKQKFIEMMEFSRQAGFKTFYLWGVEWWYWEKEANKDPVYWNMAKDLFSGTAR